MNLNGISVVPILLNLVHFCSLESIGKKNKKPFIVPCFEDDANHAQCFSPDGSCEKAGTDEFKLVRLQGLRVSERFDSINLLKTRSFLMPG